MRLLVTGGRGFVGRNLVPLLAKHEVISLVHPAEETGNGGTGRIRELAGDLASDGAWQADVERFAPDCCIHLAWDGLPDYSLARCRVNVNASIGLIETLVRARVKRVVVAGTCWEYGRASGSVSEDAVPVDYSVFAAAKHAIRTMLEAVAREAKFDYRWARIFFVYGPGQRAMSLIPHLRAAAIADRPLDVREPQAVQDFVHVEDVARGLLSLAECDAGSGIFNLGSGRPASVARIANIVAEHFGRKPPFENVAGGAGFWANADKMRSACGWRAEIGIEEGVAKTLAAPDGAA